MNLLKAADGQFSFQLEAAEKNALCKLLKLYPVVPAGHHQLSRSAGRPEDQQLLDEALASQRAAHQAQIRTLLNAKTRFRPNQLGFTLALKASQMEWLLQVLNDVRVGSWLQLGAPDGPGKMFAALSAKTAPQFWAMELSGHFQMTLLQAMTGDGGASTGPSAET